jgi:hypothetical protein
MSAGYVYFLQAFGRGPIKIGYSTNPRRRFSALRTASPEPLDLVATMPGDRNLELRLHEMFGSDRLHGEWFKDSLALCTLIEVLIAPDLDNPLHRDVHREIDRLEKRWESERELEEVAA